MERVILNDTTQMEIMDMETKVRSVREKINKLIEKSQSKVDAMGDGYTEEVELALLRSALDALRTAENILNRVFTL